MRQNIKIWKKQQIFPSFWQKKLGDTISLCMIMRNEEKLLARCLKSVKGLVDEIIICDTGSTDQSIQIARAHGARIFQDPWRDDFSRPRNIAIAAATMNYILILDPDEVISHVDHNTLREHTRHPEIIAWQMATRNYTNNPWLQNTHQNPKDFLNAKNFYGFVPSIKTRFFQNHKNIFFQKVWHELLDYDILKYKYKFTASPVPVHHYPHEINQVDIKEKQRFYLRLGRKKAALDPNDNQAQWELAVAEHIAGNHGRAFKACALSLRNGIYGPDRLYFLAALARAKGGVKEHRLIFEKAVCKTYPNLTHINPVDKTPLHEAPKPQKQPWSNIARYVEKNKDKLPHTRVNKNNEALKKLEQFIPHSDPPVPGFITPTKVPNDLGERTIPESTNIDTLFPKEKSTTNETVVKTEADPPIKTLQKKPKKRIKRHGKKRS